MNMRVNSSDRELNANVFGQGEPVLTIHGAFYARGLEPLADALTSSQQYKVITWERFGYGASDRPQAPYELRDVIADALAVLHAAGEERAHVVAHSAGCISALQFALDHPEAVHTLTLIEPVLPTPEWGQFVNDHFTPAGAHLQNGDAASALDTCFVPVYGGSHYKSEMDGKLPDGWYEQALADLPNLFLFESPALREFQMSPETGSKLKMPVLVTEGENTEPIWVANIKHFLSWVPHAEHRVIPDGIHMSPVIHAAETAEVLADFLKKHPLTATSSTA
jgi:pimeloyl-ACP methyl ester carboxylesterase